MKIIICLIVLGVGLLTVNLSPVLAADGLNLSGVANPVATAFPLATTSLGGVISSILRITLMIVSFLLFVWLAWGIFQYLFAGGSKENLKKAQARITYALVGFVITILAFAISGLVQALADPNKTKILEQIFVR